MRPVRRGASPITTDFADYKKAKPYLVSRLGSGWFETIHMASYCSYCERPIPTNLAVEHLQPKGLEVGHIKPYAHLEGKWENFLLGCVNCNSSKSDKDVVISEVLLPDRDNTFLAYKYTEDGKVKIADNLTNVPVIKEKAKATLALVGLDKKPAQCLDENSRAIALERVTQRKNAWLTALSVKVDIENEPTSEGVKRGAIRTALAVGFFSIWMAVFAADAAMRNRLIDAFAGTRASECFDPVTTLPVSPAPNPDALPDGGKL